MGLCHSKKIIYFYKQDDTYHPITRFWKRLYKEEQLLNDKYTLYLEKKDNKEIAVTAVFKDGRATYATLFKHNRVWYAGDVNDKLQPRGTGTLYHENSEVPRFKGRFYKETWNGVMYDKKGNWCMNGRMSPYGTWCLDGIIKIYTSTRIYDVKTVNGTITGSDKKPWIRYDGYKYEKGTFYDNRLCHGVRIMFNGHEEKVYTVRRYEVIDINTRKRQIELPKGDPMELLGFIPKQVTYEPWD